MPEKKPPTVEDCISRAVFGAEDNVFTGFRKQGNKILSYENDYVLSGQQPIGQADGHPYRKTGMGGLDGAEYPTGFSQPPVNVSRDYLKTNATMNATRICPWLWHPDMRKNTWLSN